MERKGAERQRGETFKVIIRGKDEFSSGPTCVTLFSTIASSTRDIVYGARRYAKELFVLPNECLKQRRFSELAIKVIAFNSVIL